MAKKKEKKTPKQKPKVKTAAKKSPAKKKIVAKSAAKKAAPVKKAGKPAAKKTVVKKAAKPVAPKQPPPKPAKAAKPAREKPLSRKELKEKQKKEALAARESSGFIPPHKRPAFVPPVEKPKGTPTQLSMALEEVKPVISYKPRVTRSKSGNLVYQLEYTIRSSPAILYEFLTTPSGLAQWFADKVDIYDHKCIFEWEGIEETATIIDSIEDVYIRYKWDDSDEDEYFEFRISKNEITGDTILTITDFASELDIKDDKLLWDSQVKLLVQQVGG